MASLSGGPTYWDVMQEVAPDGSALTVLEILAQTNRILDDAIATEANGGFSHTYNREDSLPTGSFRQLNGGVRDENPTSKKMTEHIAMLESYSTADKTLAKRHPLGANGYRMSRASRFIRGMGQNMAGKIFYGNEATAPEEVTGLAPRLNSLAQSNLYDGGGEGVDTTSIFGVQWIEDQGTYLTYPQGSESAGIIHEPLGQVTVEDANGLKYEALRDHFEVHFGLCVADEAMICRYANIEVTGVTNTFNENILIEMVNDRPLEGLGLVLYVHNKLSTQMQIAAKDKTNILWSIEEGLGGRKITTFMGFPVHRCDQILLTETAVE